MTSHATALVVLLLLAQETRAAGLSFAADGLEQCRARVAQAARGEVVYIEQSPAGGAGVALTACSVLDASAADVWPVLRDCELYQEFLPGVTRSGVRDRRGDTALCDALIDLPFPLGELRSVERVRERGLPDGGFERRWSLESGTYRRLEGSWTVLPWNGEEQRALLVYQLDMDPDTVVPDFALRRAQSATAPEVFAAISGRVRDCRSSPPSCGGR